MEPNEESGRVAGEWTINAIEEAWKQACQWCEEKNVILDMGQVSEMDTAGVQIVALLDRHCRVDGGTLSLWNCRESVKRILELYGMDSLLGGEDDESR